MALAFLYYTLWLNGASEAVDVRPAAVSDVAGRTVQVKLALPVWSAHLRKIPARANVTLAVFVACPLPGGEQFSGAVFPSLIVRMKPRAPKLSPNSPAPRSCCQTRQTRPATGGWAAWAARTWATTRRRPSLARCVRARRRRLRVAPASWPPLLTVFEPPWLTVFPLWLPKTAPGSHRDAGPRGCGAQAVPRGPARPGNLLSQGAEKEGRGGTACLPGGAVYERQNREALPWPAYHHPPPYSLISVCPSVQVDVEGHELAVFRGAASLLGGPRERRPR